MKPPAARSAPRRRAAKAAPRTRPAAKTPNAAATLDAAGTLRPAELAAFRRRLLAWFDEHARDLPWRRTRDPYRVWVSEVMLQQTQVATVVEYFNRFVAELPSIAALAAAPEERVLRLWEGLGYYRRARQLHAAAQRIAREHGGQFPRDADAARRLPGVGRYTAGAVLSIAYDLPLPIVEANTARLLSRLIGLRDEPARAASQRRLWQAAEQLVSPREPGKLNQALMELGSLVCVPREPRCPACPVARWCAARRAGLEQSIPVTRSRPKTEAVREAAVVVSRRGEVLLWRRGPGGRWAGLWDFPRFEIAATDEAPLRDELAAKVAALIGVQCQPLAPFASLTHGVTRFRITLAGWRAHWLAGRARAADGGEVRWVRPAALGAYPLSVTGRKLVARFVASADDGAPARNGAAPRSAESPSTTLPRRPRRRGRAATDRPNRASDSCA